MESKCKYCEITFENMTSQLKANHTRWCNKNPNIIKNDSKPFLGKHHTAENKKILSDKRKQWLKDNPDKHPWKSNKKFISIPCERLKEILKLNNISFLDEGTIVNGRYYSADIYFPDKKLVLEVNGNQHYNKDKTLKPYYQERYNNFISNGWEVIEIPYMLIYNEDYISKLIFSLKNKYVLGDIDYSSYIKIKSSNCCVECGATILPYSTRCKKCSSIVNGVKKRKFDIKKEDLEILIKEKTMVEIGKMYNVSDNAIKKRAKKLKLI